MKCRLLIILTLLIGLVAPWEIGIASAEEINHKDAQAIHSAVQSQLNALAEDDAVKAFNFATSSTRDMMGSADNFMQLIKNEYPAIYRYRSAIFSTPEMIDGQTLQIVRITDRDNSVWVAIYRMQQESDGNWKIDGCRLLKTTSVSV